MIQSTVYERQGRQREAIQNIQSSYAGAQRLMGPVLVLPYTETYTSTVRERDPKTDALVQKEVPQRHDGKLFFLPRNLTIQSDLTTDFKYRGLFRALTFRAQAAIQGQFELPAALPVNRRADNSLISWGKPTLALPLDDTRGLASIPRLSWQGEPLQFDRGTGIGAMPDGIHARVGDVTPGGAQAIDFRIDLVLSGTGTLGFVPLAGNTRVTLDSGWPHPSFSGRFLPDPESQSVGDDGFHAEWEITSLATSAPRQFLDRVGSGSGGECQPRGCLEGFEVRLIEPVNIYSMAERALKYDFLFVVVGFAAFFLFELLKGLRVHPAQYLLVGLALALFFLLLLSLSEHIAFPWAYLVASTASVSLVGYYLYHVLGGLTRALGFAGLLGALYAALYGLLISEDNSLLMGSLLLFGLLAVTMVITRRFDWYGLPGLAPRPRKDTAENPRSGPSISNTSDE
jgi:inner membrane protein